MAKTYEDYKKEYETYSSKASEINRTLALGGIGIIWIFKNTTDKLPIIPENLILPLFWLILSLTFL